MLSRMTAARIIIAAKPRKPISVDFVGVEYFVTPPKSALAIALAERAHKADSNPGALMSELENWVRIAFGKNQGGKVLARLQDPEDDLDMPDIMELIQKLSEAVTPNPSS